MLNIVRKGREKPDAVGIVVDFVTGMGVVGVKLYRWQGNLYYYTWTDEKGRTKYIICNIDEGDKIAIDRNSGRPIYVIWGTYVEPDIFVGFSKKMRPEDKFLKVTSDKSRVFLEIKGETGSEFLGDILANMLEDIYRLEQSKPVIEVTPHVYFGYSGSAVDLVCHSVASAVESFEDANDAIGQIIKSAGTLDKLKGLLHTVQRNPIVYAIAIMLAVIGIAVAISIIMSAKTPTTAPTHVSKIATRHVPTRTASTSGGVHVVKRGGTTVATPKKTTHITRPKVTGKK